MYELWSLLKILLWNVEARRQIYKSNNCLFLNPVCIYYVWCTLYSDYFLNKYCLNVEAAIKTLFLYFNLCLSVFVCLMVFNATFNNISFISWRSVLLMEETNDLLQVTDKLYHIMLYTLPWVRFELTTSVVIGTDCTGSCKSNYHTIRAMMAPMYLSVILVTLSCSFTFISFFITNCIQI